jgi:hypothetical protein
MSELITELVAASDIGPADRDAMFALMDAVYAGMGRAAFEEDLAAKDTCITLRTPSGALVGFSTQQRLSVETGGTRIDGIFSGDTVIHPDHWGSPALFQAFSRAFITDRTPPLQWFLISKGHRTYRMLTTFFQRYYPSRREPTPDAARRIMDAYATALYPDDYNPASGVIEYRRPKDRLRDGVAGIAERDLRNPDVTFFVHANPGWAQGQDLVCLCELTLDNLVPRMRPLLLGADAEARR